MKKKHLGLLRPSLLATVSLLSLVSLLAVGCASMNQVSVTLTPSDPRACTILNTTSANLMREDSLQEKREKLAQFCKVLVYCKRTLPDYCVVAGS